MRHYIKTPTRKVVVRVFGEQEWVPYQGEIVVEVDAHATDEQINEMIRRNARRLPEPDSWEEVDELNDIELAEDAPHVVVGDADPDEKPDVRLFVKRRRE